MAVLRRCGLLLQTEWRGLSICRSLCLSRSWDPQKRPNRSRCRLGCGRWRNGAAHCDVSLYGQPSISAAAMRPLCQLTLTICLFLSRFYRASYASAVLGVVILFVLPSVCLSVRSSQACFVANPKNRPAIFLYHTKGQSF